MSASHGFPRDRAAKQEQALSDESAPSSSRRPRPGAISAILPHKACLTFLQVPSASRPGQFAYLHVPTGYKQSFPPACDELPDAWRRLFSRHGERQPRRDEAANQPFAAEPPAGPAKPAGLSLCSALSMSASYFS